MGGLVSLQRPDHARSCKLCKSSACWMHPQEECRRLGDLGQAFLLPLPQFPHLFSRNMFAVRAGVLMSLYGKHWRGVWHGGGDL